MTRWPASREGDGHHDRPVTTEAAAYQDSAADPRCAVTSPPSRPRHQRCCPSGRGRLLGRRVAVAVAVAIGVVAVSGAGAGAETAPEAGTTTPTQSTTTLASDMTTTAPVDTPPGETATTPADTTPAATTPPGPGPTCPSGTSPCGDVNLPSSEPSGCDSSLPASRSRCAAPSDWSKVVPRCQRQPGRSECTQLADAVIDCAAAGSRADCTALTSRYLTACAALRTDDNCARTRATFRGYCADNAHDSCAWAATPTPVAEPEITSTDSSDPVSTRAPAREHQPAAEDLAERSPEQTSHQPPTLAIGHPGPGPETDSTRADDVDQATPQAAHDDDALPTRSRQDLVGAEHPPPAAAQPSIPGPEAGTELEPGLTTVDDQRRVVLAIPLPSVDSLAALSPAAVAPAMLRTAAVGLSGDAGPLGPVALVLAGLVGSVVMGLAVPRLGSPLRRGGLSVS